jgi:hypothetical protein
MRADMLSSLRSICAAYVGIERSERDNDILMWKRIWNESAARWFIGMKTRGGKVGVSNELTKMTF